MFRFPVSIALCSIVALLWLSPVAHSQAGQYSAHIEVVVRPKRATAIDAEALPRLKTSDFALRQQGNPITIHGAKSEAAYSKHLLIIVPNALPPCPQLSSLRELQRLIGEGWIIQIADQNGAITSPLSDTDSLQATCSKAASSSAVMPIQDLAKRTGRRIVLFTAPPSPEFLTSAIRSIPEVYSVDGGVQVSSKSGLLAVPQPTPAASPESELVYTVPCHPVGDRVAPNDPCNLGTTTSYYKNGFNGGVIHEKSIAAALQNLLSNNRYYDLSFRMPPQSKAAVVPLDLTIHCDGNLSLAITMYTETNHNSNDPVRYSISNGIRVAQRR